MTLPTWPVALPLADLSLQPQKPFTRTPMDSGIPRQRRRFRVYPVALTVQFILEAGEYAIYSDFAENDLDGWTGWFMLTIRDARGIRPARVRFIDTPTDQLLSNGGLWRVSGKIEKLNID